MSALAPPHPLHTPQTPLALEYFDESLPYEAILDRQHTLLAKRIKDTQPDTLLIGQHGPVITFGRRTPDAQKKSLAPTSIPRVETNRGGEVTYHGPGQLVAYPILQLSGSDRDLHGYLRRLEAWLVAVLASFEIQAQGASVFSGASNHPRSRTGVWVKDRKIASLGIGVQQWVTFHGVALNVSPDLRHFEWIQPCGYAPSVMTRMVDVNPDLATLPNLIEQVEQHMIQLAPHYLGAGPL